MKNKLTVESYQSVVKNRGFIQTLNLVSGFTLVEMLISVSLFVTIATLSIGALLVIFDANKKAQSTRTVVDNLNLSIENMARTVRFGSLYHCGSGSISSTKDCSTGDTLLALSFNGSSIVYTLCGTAINRSDTGNTNCTGAGTYPITSPETVIEYLKFYVFGSSDSDTVQPLVVAVIRGYVGTKPTIQSRFQIETVMSQRSLDL